MRKLMVSTPKMLRFRRDTSKSTDLLLKKRGGKLFVVFFFIVTVSWSFGASAQTARPALGPDIDAKTRQQIVDEVIRQLHSRYVLPGAVETLEAHLRGKLHAGGYDNATSAARLAQALTQDLRTVGDDLHLEVSYDPKREQALKAAGADTNARLPDLALSAE